MGIFQDLLGTLRATFKIGGTTGVVLKNSTGNLLVRDEGVSGVVLRLTEPAFTAVTVEGNRVRAGTGAAVSALISESTRHGLAGLETLVGIPGTGGAQIGGGGGRLGGILGLAGLIGFALLRGVLKR